MSAEHSTHTTKKVECWEKYKLERQYKELVRWATKEPHVEAALSEAFFAGWNAAGKHFTTRLVSEGHED